MSLALSTAWNSFRYTHADDLLREIKNLGFEAIELGFSLTAAMVYEIEALISQEGIKVVSLHNYCPIPDGLKIAEALPDCYSMSSLDEEIRRKAIKYSKITIDTAQRLNAQAIVMHCGRVDIPDSTRELANLFNQGLKDSNKYNLLKDKALQERNKFYKPYLKNTLKSLEELNNYAENKNVLLGIENRFYVQEIPSFEEIGLILNNFRGSNIFYWHDTGHAQVLDNLGFNPHCEYLDAYSDYMVGVHLHNCIATSDHRAPHLGEIDFNLLNPYLRKETLKVIEAHHPSSSQDLIKSKKFLEVIFNGKL